MNAIFSLIGLLLTGFELLLLARVLLSWFPNVDYDNPIIRFLYEATEPVLKPVREALGQFQGGMPIDFSPLVVFLAIRLLRIFIGI